MALSLTAARAEVGLRTPSYAAKKLIWSHIALVTDSGKTIRGYKPTQNARQAHQADARYVGVSGGWRSGKSLFSAMEALAWLPYAKLIWIIGRDYDTTRAEFIYLADGAVSCGLARPGDVRISMSKYSPSVLKSITGCIVETRTLADYRKLAAKAPDVVIVSEPGLIPNFKAVMELVSGRVAQKRGAVICAGTSDESSEEWYELWSRWQTDNPEGGQSFSIPSWQNTYIFPKGRREETFRVYQEVYGEEAFLAHYGGHPAAPQNLTLRGVWSEKLHVLPDLIWTPGLPTEIAIDPNYAAPNAYTVEVIQWDLGSGSIFLVDEVAESGLHHEAIKDICRGRPWWPHVMGGTIDPFAEGSPYGNPTPVSYWVPLHLRYNHRPHVATSLQALKEALAIQIGGEPRMRVAPACARFRKEAVTWRTDKYGRPEKTWCDAMKATAYWLVDRFGDERLASWDNGESNAVEVSDWTLE